MSMARVRTASISAIALGAVLTTAVGVSGCATSQEEILPTHGTTMADIWAGRAQAASGAADDNGETGDSTHVTDLERARAALRRPLDGGDVGAINAAYTRNATNEIRSQFQRLPNPDMTLFIFPHLSGGAGEQVPVPGYSTIFPLYRRPHYGQPGERVEYQAVGSTRATSR